METIVTGLVVGAIFGAGWYLTIYGLEYVRVLWKIKTGKSEDL